LDKEFNEHGREGKLIEAFVGNSEAEKELGNPRRGWEINIKN
jgi:hypothetical protein